MQTRQLGPFTVSALGLGCMNLSAGYGPADDATSADLLHRALDIGYRFLDTAAVYGAGHNETLIGNTLASRRNEFVLATKCGMTRDDQGLPKPSGRPDNLKRECDDSLRRLKTDVIDLYYLHRVDADVPIEESVGALADLVTAGKVRTIGLSEVCSETVRRAHREHPITAIQSEYSLWSRTPERGVFDCCRDLGITFVPFSPLGRGFFTGEAADVTTLTADDIRQSIARPRFEPEAYAHNSRLLEPFSQLANQHGCSPAQLSLAWLLHKQDSALIPIPGTRQISHLEENAASTELSLEPSLIAELDALFDESAIEGTRYSAAIMATIDAERD